MSNFDELYITNTNSTAAYEYAAFNDLPEGKTIFDVDETERWLFDTPITNANTDEADIDDWIVNENTRRRVHRKNYKGLEPHVDEIFDTPIDVVKRKRLVIRFSWD